MEEKNLNPMNLFGSFSESYEEAVKKNSDESKSFQKIKHFRMESAGDYSVRILPIAPVQQEDGSWATDRKGYEYPIKTQVLKIDNPMAKTKKDKKNIFVGVCQATFAGLSVDLIDTYLRVAEDLYGRNEKLLKKIKGSNFEGGLKWNSQRAMYIFDTAKRGEGIQLLSLSYSQYRELEERKLKIWKALNAKNPGTPCPISSPASAYPVEITRKEENGKTSYSFNIDTLSTPEALTEEEVQALISAPRLPETLYRYTRFHLEATVAFLKQFDEKMEINVMGSKEISETIEKIKMELPSDDKSHFTFDKKSEETEGDSEKSNTPEAQLSALWKRLKALEDEGLDDKDEECLELRDDIRSFIDDNNLEVRITRAKTNEDLLNAIEDALENEKSGVSHEDEDEDEEEETEEENSTVVEEEDDRPRRGSYNADTNEPALGTERRVNRPARRRD